jgi:hypothetical protein
MMDLKKINEQLLQWISLVCPQDNVQLMQQKQDELQKNGNPQQLYLDFARVPKIIGKAKLKITDTNLKIANELRPGWNPANLTADRAVRIFLLLSFPAADPKTYYHVISKLFFGADLNEQIALYSALPLFPFPEHFLPAAYEGTRSNVTDVFDAITLDNPYPCDYFPDDAFNRLVLKAAFMGRPFIKIVGLEKRSNPALATLLLGFVNERWAAGRTFHPLLWKLIAPFLNENVYTSFKDKVDKQDELMKSAVALACIESSIVLNTSGNDKDLSWENIYHAWEKIEKTT